MVYFQSVLGVLRLTMMMMMMMVMRRRRRITTRKVGYGSMGYAPIGFLVTKRQKKTEKDRKRQKETKISKKSSIQHVSSHVKSCCNMFNFDHGIIISKL